MALEFQWDPRKAASNLTKHGVSFEVAATEVQLIGSSSFFVFELTVVDDTGNRATDTVTVRYL